MNITLYEVADNYLAACNQLLSVEDELPIDVFNDTLDSLSGEFDRKALNVAAICKNLEAEILAMLDYERAMRVRRKKSENNLERLKEYLKSNMQRCDITKITGNELTVSLRKSPPKVIIDDIDALDESFIARFEAHPDKKKIKETLEKGDLVTGAHLENNKSLIIK